MGWRRRIFGVMLGVAAVGCDGGPLTDLPKGAGDEGSGGPYSPGSFDAGAGNGGSDSSDGNLPPEQEETVSFDTPQAGKTSVYVPNPTTNRVAVVNATTFAIETLKTGRAPTFTATVPGQDVAVVINVGSRDAAVLRTESGHTSSLRLDVGHDANAIAVAPDGKHAVLYFDAKQSEELASSFQDVTVLSLTQGAEASRGVSVGFRPRAVQFSADGAQAFVLTEDGVSVIDLEAADDRPIIARLVSVGDKLSDTVSSDVQITPDGNFALARRDGDSVLRLVSLADGTIQTLDFADLRAKPASQSDAGMGGGDGGAADAGPAPDEDEAHLDQGNVQITDVDLAPDGSFALAVVRSQGALVRVPVPQGFADASLVRVRRVRDQLIGSITLAQNGKLAVAYTTAAPVEGVVLVDLEGDAPPRGVRLRKAVRAVALSNDGSRAFVLHEKVEAAGDPSDPEVRIDGSEGYSLVDTTTGFAKLELTDARLRERDIVVTRDARRMFALLRDDDRGVHAVDTADLGSFQIETVQLAKAPSSIGIVPGVGRIFVGQESEGGMITFLDQDSGDVIRSVTGFELSSRIRQ